MTCLDPWNHVVGVVYPWSSQLPYISTPLNEPNIDESTIQLEWMEPTAILTFDPEPSNNLSTNDWNRQDRKYSRLRNNMDSGVDLVEFGNCMQYSKHSLYQGISPWRNLSQCLCKSPLDRETLVITIYPSTSGRTVWVSPPRQESSVLSLHPYSTNRYFIGISTLRTWKLEQISDDPDTANYRRAQNLPL